ncbi:uncharacterized protein EI90DRAFT_3074410, partial [Cantharellus anzutake]|uniref:uncharacterized protein n=1 Tax=Cantharellus anzutake TaxID=1750568 RepID=UPI0019034D6D
MVNHYRTKYMYKFTPPPPPLLQGAATRLMRGFAPNFQSQASSHEQDIQIVLALATRPLRASTPGTSIAQVLD